MASIEYDPLCYSKECIFRGIGRCQDKVAEHICNNHAAIFGLIFKNASYTTAQGASWNRVNGYVLQGQMVDIPLFQDRNGNILLKQVNNFARTVNSKYPEIKIDKMTERIGSLFGISIQTVGRSAPYTDWLQQPGTQITTYTDSLTRVYYNPLPRLHAALLNDVYASMVVSNNISEAAQNNELANRTIMSIPNLIFESVNDPDYGPTFRFRIMNPASLLVYTRRQEMMATPLVLDALRYGQHDLNMPTTVSFTPLLADCP